MGRDYRHRRQRTESFEDGYEMFKDRKLPSYDRNKNRKQNKVNLNHFQIEKEPEVLELEQEQESEE